MDKSVWERDLQNKRKNVKEAKSFFIQLIFNAKTFIFFFFFTTILLFFSGAFFSALGKKALHSCVIVRN
jgi:hypothetical protein